MSDTPKISVLAPCLNEELNLPGLVERVGRAMASLGVPFELVLVDDGSCDRTYEVAVGLRSNAPWLKIVKHETNQGMTEGWASALEASSGEYAVLIDADMQYRPEDIAALWKILNESGADIAQGWRESNPGGSRARRIMSRAFSELLNIAFSTNLRDVKSGFLLCRRETLADILSDRKRFKYFQHFPTIAASAKGYSIAETPVVFESRAAGKSFISNATIFGLKALLDFPEAFRLYGRRKKRCAE